MFEAQVAAYYLLALLAGGHPRGLANARILRIELQRAAESHPLDDVIVHAEVAPAVPVILAIQVKRSMTFAPGDEVFRKVVGQIARTMKRDDVWSSRYELAIAIARTTQKIDGAYQDVLAWSRELGSPAVFFARLSRQGAASDDMCRFVSTFRGYLAEAGAPHDDETVWKVLGRLQILPFDFTAPGSSSLAQR